MDRAATLQQLAQLCRDGRAPALASTPSGWPQLDSLLPGSGWQAGTIVELMPAQTGLGELRLLMPALAHITRSQRLVALVTPPYIPFAPAWLQHGVQLERLLIVRAQNTPDTLWALEQTLRCGFFGAALAWPAALADRETRRLQLAAQAGRSTGFIYRSPAAARQASPAALRLRLRAQAQGDLTVDILKCRGGRSGVSATVNTWADRPAPSAGLPLDLPAASAQSRPTAAQGSSPAVSASR